ncbi:universal stress protein Slr1101 [Hydra vulgaris]|uniref:Universal stress protein Slr1101 n=1 Tax=Hydra vulgaris TaxID=6087 RepID=A0ABM4BH16_HYDVU
MSTASRTILLAVDDSETSLNAFNWYLKNFHRNDDTLLLVHVHRMPELPTMGLMIGVVPMTQTYEAIIRTSIETSNQLLASYEQRCKDCQVTSKTILADNHDSPGHVICSLAKSNNADIVITGQRGLGALSRVFLGSTSDYILHHAHIPIIVVPPKVNEH